MNTKRIGFAVNSLALSELNWRIFEQANSKPLIDTIIFAQDVDVPIEYTPVPVMKLVEGYGFSGTMVATNVRLANTIDGFPCPRSKFFYVWDLEWLRVRPLSHAYFHKAYTSPNYRLVARSDRHAQLLESNWGARVEMVLPVPDFQEFLKYGQAKNVVGRMD